MNNRTTILAALVLSCSAVPAVHASSFAGTSAGALGGSLLRRRLGVFPEHVRQRQDRA